MLFLLYSSFLYKFLFNRLGEEAVVFIGGAIYIVSYLMLSTSKWKRIDVTLLLFLAWGGLSVIWAAEPYDSLLRWLILCLTVTTTKLLAESTTIDFDGIFLRFIIAGLAITFVSFVIAPGYAFRGGNITGLFYSKNDLGIFLGISVLFLLLNPKAKSTLMRALAGTCFLLLVAINAKTVIAIVTLTYILYLIRLVELIKSIGSSFRKFSLVAKWVTLLLISIAVYFTPRFFNFLQSTVVDEFMTGRGFLWKLSLSRENAGGAFGNGFGTHWLDESLLEGGLESVQNQWIQTIEQAHNGYLEIYMNLGWVGILLLLLFIVSNLTKLLHSKFAFFMTIFMIIHNISESTWMWGMHFLFVIYLFVVFSNSRSHAT